MLTPSWVAARSVVRSSFDAAGSLMPSHHTPTNTAHPVITAPSHRRSEARRRMFRQAIQIAAEQGATIELGTTTAQALQECLDRAVSLLRFAGAQVDGISLPPGYDLDDPDSYSLADLPPHLDPYFEVIVNDQGPDRVTPHRWVAMEREARLEVEKLAAMMVQLGVAERVVRVEEAKAALMISAVREAAIDAGLDHETIRRLGAALRARVEHGPDHQSRPGRTGYPATNPSLQIREPSHGSVAEGRSIADTAQRLENVDDDTDLPTENL